jgi:hypothetical protein
MAYLLTGVVTNHVLSPLTRAGALIRSYILGVVDARSAVIDLIGRKDFLMQDSVIRQK